MGSGLAMPLFHAKLLMEGEVDVMARPLRIEFPGAVYHLTSRGNARQGIFEDDKDREAFLKLLCKVVRKYRWLCHAYCLMGNHYHLLIETSEANLSLGMRQLNGVYTQSFNRRHNRCGHLLQGRYKAILVEKERYLLALCRYVVFNPVAAGMVSSVKEWPWSSYLSTAGLTPVPELLTIDWILQQFGSHRGDAHRRYREFVLRSDDQPSPWDNLGGGVLLGDEEFVDRFQPHLSEQRDFEEIPRAQRFAHRPTLANLLTTNLCHRTEAARQAHVDWGYTLKEIAQFWGIHYAESNPVC